ncbi:MAG: VOC family protein [Acidobacteria bacterium]|nr:VOC family protein [Acidobacteriota bacterium]
MLKSRPIVAFVATTDPSRAKAFYAKTLGLHLVSEDGFALMFDAGGTMLRVAIVQTLQPAGYTVLGWIVPDIARAVRDLVKRGVTFQRYEWMTQDELSIWSSPSGARVAWFTDPDGNTLSLTESARPSKKETRLTKRNKPQRHRDTEARKRIRRVGLHSGPTSGVANRRTSKS